MSDGPDKKLDSIIQKNSSNFEYIILTAVLTVNVALISLSMKSNLIVFIFFSLIVFVFTIISTCTTRILNYSNKLNNNLASSSIIMLSCSSTIIISQTITNTTSSTNVPYINTTQYYFHVSYIIYVCLLCVFIFGISIRARKQIKGSLRIFFSIHFGISVFSSLIASLIFLEIENFSEENIKKSMIAIIIVTVLLYNTLRLNLLIYRWTVSYMKTKKRSLS